MKARKHLFMAGVGVSDAAEIATFVRASQAWLDDAWTGGTDGDPVDFVLVDLADFGGRCARVRALDEGVRFAVIADPDEDVLDAELVLHRPLAAKALVGLLNHVGQAGPARRRTLPQFGATPEHLADVSIGPRNGAPRRAAASLEPSSTRASFLEGSRERPCTDLDALLKRGALLIERAVLPALLIDPVTDTFHSSARLAELEPYFLDVVTGHECKRIGGTRLATLRKTMPGRPLARLRWLHALLRSNGWLAPHLDPSAHYRLRSWLPLDADFRKQHRIAATLFRQAPLHRIAAAAKAHMADVFDVVNAYDALGLIESTRQPVQDASVADEKPRRLTRKARSLLASAAFSR